MGVIEIGVIEIGVKESGVKESGVMEIGVNVTEGTDIGVTETDVSLPESDENSVQLKSLQQPWTPSRITQWRPASQ